MTGASANEMLLELIRTFLPTKIMDRICHLRRTRWEISVEDKEDATNEEVTQSNDQIGRNY